MVGTIGPSECWPLAPERCVGSEVDSNATFRLRPIDSSAIYCFMMHYLQTPQFTQPEVLKVTRLKPAVLQTWVNRNAIELAEQNPGTGRRRLYSALDVVKLALMRRVADLQMDLSVAREIANEAERMLTANQSVSWDLHITFKPDYATEKDLKATVIASAGISLLAMKYRATQGDASQMRVAQFTEPFEQICPRRERTYTDTDERPIDPTRRDYFASQGVHAEPVVIFPFGEIVNGTLVRLSTLRTAPSKSIETDEQGVDAVHQAND